MPLTGEAKRTYQRAYMRRQRAEQRSAGRPAPPKGPAPGKGSLVKWLGKLIVRQGHGAGAPMVVWPWQREFLQGLDGQRYGAISVPRGSGKTTLVSRHVLLRP